jgi:hypothetical protein
VLREATAADNTETAGVGTDHSAKVGQGAGVLWDMEKRLVARIIQPREAEDALEMLT